jgi:hypothetical protein
MTAHRDDLLAKERDIVFVFWHGVLCLVEARAPKLEVVYTWYTVHLHSCHSLSVGGVRCPVHRISLKKASNIGLKIQ